MKHKKREAWGFTTAFVGLVMGLVGLMIFLGLQMTLTIGGSILFITGIYIATKE